MIVDDADPGPEPEGIATLRCPTLMEGAAGRRKLAERVLELGRGL